MRPLSVCTTVHNEAHRIEGWMAAAKTYADEIIVVDQSSTDGTGDIARDLGAVVVTDEHHGHAEPSRTLMVNTAQSPAVLVLDADEVLAGEIDVLLNLHWKWAAVWLDRKDYVDGRDVTPEGNQHLRYFRKGAVDLSPEVHSHIVLNYDWRRAGVETITLYQPYILHTKSQAEKDLDQARYETLMVSA